MDYTLKTRQGKSRQEVFDHVRKKWVALTPEENVRQRYLLYLLNVKKFPLSHISIEHAVEVNGMLRRYDMVVFDEELKPFLVVECKAPSVNLSREVVEQACRYNMTLRAPYVCVTNGADIAMFAIDFENGTTERVS